MHIDAFFVPRLTGGGFWKNLPEAGIGTGSYA